MVAKTDRLKKLSKKNRPSSSYQLSLISPRVTTKTKTKKSINLKRVLFKNT